MDTRSQLLGGQRKKFIRCQNGFESKRSLGSEDRLSNYGVNTDNCESKSSSISSSVRRGLEKSSQGLKNIGRSLHSGVSRVAFSKDLETSGRKIFDPQDKSLRRWNRCFVISCIIAVAVDPLLFYLPVVDDQSRCLDIDRNLAITVTVLRSLLDIFYLVHMVFQFRTAFIAPSSRVSGRGELVIDPVKIAKRYGCTFFGIDVLAVLPLPQVVIWVYLQRTTGSDVLHLKNALWFIVLFQYLPRFFRIYLLTSEVVKTAGVFTETAWAAAGYNLMLYMLASHVFGAFWYLLAVEREDTCWQNACRSNFPECKLHYLYCGNDNDEGFIKWKELSNATFGSDCSATNGPFNFGIYTNALSLRIVASRKFVQKYFYCLWWGLQNLSTLGQGLTTSKFLGEVVFSITLAFLGLIIFALLIGNMLQSYLQSLTTRLEEMRVKQRDTEQWMHRRLLPKDLRKRIRQYEQYKWLERRGVDEENLVQSFPRDLRRDIKRHLCLGLVRRVDMFREMDDRLQDAVCEYLKPSLYTKDAYILREGDPVYEMLFIFDGRLQSMSTGGGRTGFLNRGFLKQGDFCGEELLTWALHPKPSANLPSSTRTVRALSEVEAFALRAEDLNMVARMLTNLHIFRYHSQHWKTWAAGIIQAAWHRYCNRKSDVLRKSSKKHI